MGLGFKVCACLNVKLRVLGFQDESIGRCRVWVLRVRALGKMAAGTKRQVVGGLGKWLVQFRVQGGGFRV